MGIIKRCENDIPASEDINISSLGERGLFLRSLNSFPTASSDVIGMILY